MSQTYMERYIGKNIYKVLNPPGGQSSFKIGWDQPSSNVVRKKAPNNANNNNALNYEYTRNNQPNYAENKAYVNNYPNIQKSRRRKEQYNDRSFNQRQNMHTNNFDYDFSSPQLMISKKSPKNNYQLGNLPDYSIKQSYKQYMDPNFIEPININQNHSLSHLYQWQQSTRQMQEELKYYQQKNKLLKQKLYGGYTNQQTLNKYTGEYHQGRRRVSSLAENTEELELALQQRYKHRINHSP